MQTPPRGPPPGRVFLPLNSRLAIEALPPLERLAVEAHLDNLAAFAAQSDDLDTFLERFADEGGRRVSFVERVRVTFTADPYSRVLFVHGVTPMP